MLLHNGGTPTIDFPAPQPLFQPGFYLRQDIIWKKPNPMPESVTDRCTKAHEYVFLMAKSERYHYDAEAIKEAASFPEGPGNLRQKYSEAYEAGDERMRTKAGLVNIGANSTRNRRSVWTVTTQPYRESHFATFPPDLIKPMILAGCPAKCCPNCGAPWERIVERGEPDTEHQAACGADATGGYNGHATKDYAAGRAQDPSAVKARILAGMRNRTTIGFQPTCACGETATAPGTVLDPFAGSGTTGMVALELGRRAVLIELNPEYVKLIRQRTDVTMGMAL
jgi:hypothetical protein